MGDPDERLVALIDTENAKKFEKLLCMHPDLNRLYENYRIVKAYYKGKLDVHKDKPKYRKIDTFRYIGDQYGEELTDVEYDLFKFLFEIIPLKKQGSGTKDLMKKLRQNQWEIISLDDRKKILGYIDKLFELDSPYRITRYFRYKTKTEIERKTEKIRFMLSDPVRYRLVESLSCMLLLAHPHHRLSDASLHRLESTVVKTYKKCISDIEEEYMKEIMEGESIGDAQKFMGSFEAGEMWEKHLTDLTSSMKNMSDIEEKFKKIGMLSTDPDYDDDLKLVVSFKLWYKWKIQLRDLILSMKCE